MKRLWHRFRESGSPWLVALGLGLVVLSLGVLGGVLLAEGADIGAGNALAAIVAFVVGASQFAQGWRKEGREQHSSHMETFEQRDAVNARIVELEAAQYASGSAGAIALSPGPRFSWTPDWGRLPLRRRYP